MTWVRGPFWVTKKQIFVSIFVSGKRIQNENTSHLINALQDGGGLNAEAHKAVVKAAGSEARTARLKEEQVNLDGLKESGGRKVAKCLERMGEMGAWLSVIPNHFDGSELSREEFLDNPAIRYGAWGAFLNAAMDATNPLVRWRMG